MSRSQWLNLAKRLSLLSGTSNYERAILANVLAGQLSDGDRRCLRAMRDRHLGAAQKVLTLHQPPIRRQQR